jgi:hypothetical protein
MAHAAHVHVLLVCCLAVTGSSTTNSVRDGMNEEEQFNDMTLAS